MNPSELQDNLLQAITGWQPTQDGEIVSWPFFESMAQQIFCYQYEHNEPYRKYCDRRNFTPENWSGVANIPAVPTDVFKHVTFRCFPQDQTLHTFYTSGTTQGARGAHPFKTLDVYRASLHPTFTRFCNPAREPLSPIILAPSFDDLPESSLSFMLQELVYAHTQTTEGEVHHEDVFFVRKKEQDASLHVALDALHERLHHAQEASETVAILGTAFGFMALLDASQTCWQLPTGSFIMETGGFKGKSREISKTELYSMFHTRLGIPETHVVSEYSMTELSSQAYTDNVWCHHQNTERTQPGFLTPPWAKLQIVDPMTLRPYDEPNKKGLIRWVDLANIHSVCAIQTSDMGIAHESGHVELLGRAPNSELRGCSLTIEEILEQTS